MTIQKTELTYQRIITCIESAVPYFKDDVGIVKQNKPPFAKKLHLFNRGSLPISYQQLYGFCYGHGAAEVISKDKLGKLVDLFVYYDNDISTGNKQWRQLWLGLKADVTKAIKRLRQQGKLSKDDYQSLMLRMQMADKVKKNQRVAELAKTWQQLALSPDSHTLTLKELQLLAMEYTAKVAEASNDLLILSNQLLDKYQKQDETRNNSLQCDEQHCLTGKELHQLSEILLTCRQQQRLEYIHPSSWANVLLSFAAQRIEKVLPHTFQLEIAERQQEAVTPLSTVVTKDSLVDDVIESPNTYQQTFSNAYSFHDNRPALTLQKAWNYYHYYTQHCGFFRDFLGGIFYPKPIKALHTLLKQLSADVRYRSQASILLQQDSLQQLMFIAKEPAKNPKTSLSIHVFKSLREHVQRSLDRVQHGAVYTQKPVNAQQNSVAMKSESVMEAKPTKVSKSSVTMNTAQQLSQRALAISNVQRPRTNLQTLSVATSTKWSSIAAKIASYRASLSEFQSLDDGEKLIFLRHAVAGFESMINETLTVVETLIEKISDTDNEESKEQGLSTITDIIAQVRRDFRCLLLLLHPDKNKIADQYHSEVGQLRQQLESIVKQQWGETIKQIKLQFENNALLREQCDLLMEMQDILLDQKQMIIDHAKSCDYLVVTEKDGEISIEVSDAMKKEQKKREQDLRELLDEQTVMIDELKAYNKTSGDAIALFRQEIAVLRREAIEIVTNKLRTPHQSASSNELVEQMPNPDIEDADNPTVLSPTVKAC